MPAQGGHDKREAGLNTKPALQLLGFNPEPGD